MSDTLEVNLPTYQMEPDPPRFPLRKLIKYMVVLVLLWGGYTYRADIVGLVKQAFAQFDTAMPPPRSAPPPRLPAAPPPPPPAPPAASPQADPVGPPAAETSSAAALPIATPRGNPASWITTDDYPVMALRENSEGTTGVRLIVAPQGQVVDCTITKSSGYADLDKAACSALKQRAQFFPATDADGKALIGKWERSVRWMIPQR